MNKTLLIIISAIILNTNFVFSQNRTQYFDGADTSIYTMLPVEIVSDTANIWQIGSPQKDIFDSASTLPNAIVTDTINYYPLSNTSSFLVKFPNEFPFPNQIFALQWMQKLDMDTTGDGGIIEMSNDNMQTWTNVFHNPYVYNFYGFQSWNEDTLSGGEYAFSGTDSVWRNIWLCIDANWLVGAYDTVYFRFTFKSDSIGPTVTNGNEGWMLDNFISSITILHTVKDLSLTKYMNVYPNPANGIVYIQTEKIQGYHIIEEMDLIDSEGRTVEHWTHVPVKFWFDSSKYNDGLYRLKIRTNIKTEIIPLVLLKH